MNSLFPPELRTASVVQRWSIVRTFNPDPLSGHLFYTTFYALQVARLVKWKGPYADLTFIALMHDAEEFITGDMVSPVKHEIVDEGKFDVFIEEQMKQRLPLVNAQLRAIMESEWGSSIERIVKVADKIDAVLFLIIEQRMGNMVLEPLYRDATTNLAEAWRALGHESGMAEEYRQGLWDSQVWPAIQAHWKYGSIGVL